MTASPDSGFYRAVRQREIREPRFRALSPEARWTYLALRVDAPNFVGLFAFSWEAAEGLTGLTRRRLTRALDELRRGRHPWLYLADGLCWIPGALAGDPFVRLTNPKQRRYVERVLASFPDGAPLVRRFRRHYGLFGEHEAEGVSAKGSEMPPREGCADTQVGVPGPGGNLGGVREGVRGGAGPRPPGPPLGAIALEDRNTLNRNPQSVGAVLGNDAGWKESAAKTLAMIKAGQSEKPPPDVA